LLPDYQNLCPKCAQWLKRDATAATLTINWLNCTTLIHGLDLFRAHQSAILLSAIFSRA